MSAHPTQLFALLLSAGRIEQLEQALAKTRDRMKAGGESEIWLFWQASMLAAKGSFDEAEAIAQTLTGELAFNTRRAIVVERGKQKGEWALTSKFLEDHWIATKSPADLLVLCEAKLNAGDAQFVASHARELLEAVGTQEALRIALMGAGRSQSFRLCLDLLDENTRLFPGEKLPADLRRLRITCEQNLGMLSVAVQHAQELVGEGREIEDVVRLFDLRVRSGNLKDAAGPALDLVKNPTTSADLLVRIGWIMRLEDKTLSGEALRRAVDRGISPAAIGPATVLAHELEMPELSAVLVPKMAQEATKPNASIKAVDIKEVLVWKKEFEQHAVEVFNMLRSGAVPVHVVESALSVAQVLWPVLALAAERHGFQGTIPPIFFRHGGRPATPAPRTIKRLYVDFTAFINAHELGLLPLVEKAFGPLFVPPSLRVALLQHLDRLARSQPDLEAARADLLKLCDAQRIGSLASGQTAAIAGREDEGLSSGWWDCVDEAERCDGLIVDYWPKLKSDFSPYVPPVEVANRLTNAIAVARALRKLGSISGEQLSVAERELAQAPQYLSATKEPQRGTTLLTSSAMAEAFAHAHILEPMVKEFRVVVPHEDIEFLRRETRSQDGRSYVHGRVNAMLQRLRIGAGYNELVMKDALPSPEGQPETSAVVATVGELMQAAPTEGHWMWADDRWTNGHERYGGSPIISTLGVIEELRRGACLNDEDYYGFRHRLRSADFRYIPMSAEELLFYVKQAEVKDGHLTETPELLAVRRYFARAILDRNTLQLPPFQFPSPRPAGEAEFLMSSVRAVVDAIIGVFHEDTTSELQQARASWLFDHLWCTPEHFAQILGRTPNDPDPKSTEGAGDSLFLARLIDQQEFKTKDALKQCLTWLSERLFSDTSRKLCVAGQVARTLEKEAGRKHDGATPSRVRFAVLTRWYFSLPESVREHVYLSSRLKQRLSIANRSVVTVGGTEFASKEFWTAAEAAYNGLGAQLAPLSGGELLSLHVRRSGKEPALIFKGHGQDQPWGFEDEMLRMLDKQRHKRRTALQEHPEWLDAPSISMSAAQLCSIQDASLRLSQIDEQRGRSVWHRYRTIKKHLASKSGPTVKNMTPVDPVLLAHYLRWPKNDPKELQADWEAIGRRLLESIGWEETFLRLATLPRSLPTPVIASFDRLSPVRRQKLLEKLANTCSPLVRAHLLRLNRRGAKAGSALDDFAGELLSEKSLNDARALLQLVRWTWGRLGEFNPKPGIGSTARLAFSWVHAGRLFEVLRAVSSTSHVMDFFTRIERQTSAEMFVAADGEDDIIYPRNLTAEVLMVTTVASALADKLGDSPPVADSLRSQVRVLMSEQQAGLTWPKPEWLYNPSVFSDALSSFTALPRERLLPDLVGEELAKYLSSANLTAQMEALIAGLEEDPGKGNVWTMLGVVMRGRPCPEALRSRMGALAKRIDFMALDLGEEARYSALLTLSAQAWQLGGEELVRKFQNQIAAFAGWLKQLPTKAGSRQREEMIVRCVLSLARHVSNGRAVAYCAEAMLAAWRQWPELGGTLRVMVPFFLQLPNEQLTAFWELILHIRRDMPAGGHAE